MSKKKLIGKVVSSKMNQTIVVEVERIKEHPKYKRRYKVHKKYKAHDEKRECLEGDVVVIEECRPLSKDKKWKFAEKIKSAPHEEAAEEIIPESEEAEPASEKKEEVQAEQKEEKEEKENK